MLSSREQEKSKVDEIIYRLERYAKSDPIMPSTHSEILRTLIKNLHQSDKSIAIMRRLIENACVELDDKITHEAISATPFAWTLPQDSLGGTFSFMRGVTLFKSPFFLAVWLESLLWSRNINQAAEDSLKRWDLDENITELQTILHECKSELSLPSKSRFDSPKINWYRIGFYAVATAGIAVATEMALSQDNPSQSHLPMLGM